MYAMSEFYITNLEESFYSLITLCEMTATKSKAFYLMFFLLKGDGAIVKDPPESGNT